MKKILLFIVGIFGIFGFCSADGIYWNQGSGLISIVYNSGSNTITLQDKNLGATCFNTTDSCSYGNYYQRGNNFGFGSSNLNNNDVYSPDLTNYGPGNYYNSNGIHYELYGDNQSTPNYNLWGGVTGTPEAMQGPCPDGFHVIDSWDNLSSIFSSLNLTFNRPNLQTYLYFPIAGYVPREYDHAVSQGNDGWYWASTSTMEFRGNRIELYYLYDNLLTSPSTIAHAGSIRCFKNEAVSPTFTWNRIFGDVIEYVPTINVYYNNDDDFVSVNCNGDNSIFIDGLSTYNSNSNTFTPYMNIDYTDEDNQSLIESYDKSILYLSGGLFKKTYTGNNDWILTAQGGNSSSSFTGYVPIFDVTGTTQPANTEENMFNNFADNSLKVLLSNIPGYIQYGFIFMFLLLILSVIKLFKRKK